jgi:hypothetical protein
MSWEHILKGAILKPKPPKNIVRIKNKNTVRVQNDPEPEPEDEYDTLHDNCRCDLPKCKRNASFGCILCGAMLCRHHKTNIADNRVRIDGGRQTSAAHIHTFQEGKCEGGEFVNPDGSKFGRRSWS